MVGRGRFDNFVWNKIIRYIHVAHPSGHLATQDVQNLFLKILWTHVVRPKGKGHGRPLSAPDQWIKNPLLYRLS